MKEAIVLTIHLLATIARLLGPGGGRSVIAENLLLKHQLLVHSRSRQRSPNLSVSDRALLGFWTLFLGPRRMVRAAIFIKPSTLLNFHAAMKRRKYRLLFSSGHRGKPGPKGPSKELINAIVAMKRRNPRSVVPESHNKSIWLSVWISIRMSSDEFSLITTGQTRGNMVRHG
jgi:hypothetical protein